MKEYEAEILKVIRGESKIGAEILNKLHYEAKEKAGESERRIREAESIFTLIICTGGRATKTVIYAG
jgi:hypothetical protein